MSSSNLPLFWNLASSDLNERINSSSTLLDSLIKQQNSLPSSTTTATSSHPSTSTQTQSSIDLSESRIPKDLSTASPDELELADKVLDESLASEVAYSLRRLLKGLASPRENSRLGFAVALTELLSHLPTISARCVLVLIIKHTTPTGAVKGQEDRDLMFGRLFGIQSLVASSLLFNPTRSTFMDLQRAIEGLINIRNRKTWLGESCSWVMVEVLEKLGSQDISLSNLSWKEEALNWVAGRCLLGREITPEKLAIILKLGQVSPKLDLERYIVPPLKNTRPLSKQNLIVLAKILKDATPPNADDEVGLAKGSSGNWKAQLHFAWNIILDIYFPREGSKQVESEVMKDRAPFHELFRVVVDESLFSPLSSSERKSWGFQVFERALSRMPADEMPLLFTPNFMRSWINHLAGADRALHAAALRTAKVVQEAVASNPKVGFALVSQLLGRYGSQHFDKITKTKTVETILASLDVSGVKEYISYLREVAYGSRTGSQDEHQQSEVQTPDSAKKWAFDQLLTLIRNTSIPKNDDCVLEILELFAVNGFASTKKVKKSDGSLSITTQPQVPYSEEIQEVCRSRFLSCLSELHDHSSTVTDSEGKTKKVQGVTSSGESWLSRGFEMISTLEKDSKHYSAVVTFDSETSEARQKALQTLAEVRKEIKSAPVDSAKSQQAKSFETVLLAALLVSYEKEEASALLEPLSDCSSRLFAPTKSSSKSKPKEGEEGTPEPTGMELLVDCLIGMLEVPSAFLRGVANQAFAPFCSEMTEESLGHLIDQLGTDDAEAEDAEAEEDGMDIDEEEDEAASDDDDTSSTSATSDASEEEDLQAEVVVDQQLRKQVAEALRASGMADSDSEGDEDEVMKEAENDAAPGTAAALKVKVDDDAESDSGSDVTSADDEQMLKLDEQLAQIFKLQTNKKGGDDAKLKSLTFQNKVLDLIEVFARKASASSSPLLLHLIRPLFTLAATPIEASKAKGEASEKQVANRAGGILRGKVCGGKGKAPTIDLKDEQALEIIMEDLEEMHSAARKPSSPEISALTSSVNSFLTRVILQSTGLEAESASKVPESLLNLYRETLKDYLTRKSSGVKPAFMLDALKRFPSLAWALREEILAGCGSEGSSQEGGNEKKTKSSMNAYREVQTMGMLQAVLTSSVQSFGTNSAPLLSFLPSICSLILSHLNASLTSSSSLGASRLKEALKFGLQAVRITRRVSSDDSKVQEIWKIEELRKVEKSIRESEKLGNNNSLAALLKQMISMIEGSNKKDGEKKERKEKKEKKEKKRAVEEDVEEKEKKVKKAKKSKKD